MSETENIINETEQEDGIAHINVHFNGKTELGKSLHPIANNPFTHPVFGSFESLEGFYHYCNTGCKEDSLRTVDGKQAKTLGRMYKRIENPFIKERTLEAINYMLKDNPSLLTMLNDNELPLLSYYTYNGITNDVKSLQLHLTEYDRIRMEGVNLEYRESSIDVSDNIPSYKKSVSSIVSVIDIETTSLALNGRILTIGAVIGDILTGAIIDRFYVRVKLEQPNRVDSESTMTFWDSVKVTNPTAYNEAFDETLERYSLKDALIKLTEFHMNRVENNDIHVFGNGPEFDINYINRAYLSEGLKIPFKYNNIQSIRTPIYLGRLLFNHDSKSNSYDPLKDHNALYDAEKEFVLLCDYVSLFKPMV